ncbi:MAG: hypothetical protein WBA10_06635 [Elainellaceae cyanobacterium]
MHKQLQHTTQEGWAIHIYNRDRHLLCTLDPSHGWTFVAGLILGLTVAVVGYNLPDPPAAIPYRPASDHLTAPLQLD